MRTLDVGFELELIVVATCCAHYCFRATGCMSACVDVCCTCAFDHQDQDLETEGWSSAKLMMMTLALPYVSNFLVINLQDHFRSERLIVSQAPMEQKLRFSL